MFPGTIDSHQHYWAIDRFNYEWMSPDDAVLCRDYLPEHFDETRRRNKVEKVVAVQAHQSVAEARWLLELADRNDFIAAVVGWVDLRDANLGETLAVLAKHPKFRGVRHIVQDEPQLDWILQPEVVRGIDLLADFGLSYDILIYPRHLPLIPELLEKCPRTAFVIDHLAKPEIAKGEIAAWKSDLARVAADRRVFCKLSGLVTEADHDDWRPEDLRPYADAALELFGPSRLMFGSDYPVCKLASDYDEVLATCFSLLDGLSDEEKASVMRTNALEFYRIG